MAKKEEVKQDEVGKKDVGNLPTHPKYVTDILAERWNIPKDEMWKALENISPKGANRSDIISCMVICNEHELNPFLNQIYIISTQKGLKPVVPIDGWIKIVNDCPRYRGREEIDNFDENGKLISVTTKMYLEGRDFPEVATEYMDECYRKDSNSWVQWPKRNLHHKSYIQCARKAIGLSGMYDWDEAERIQAGEKLADFSIVDEKTQEKTENLKERLKAATTEASVPAEEVVSDTYYEEGPPFQPEDPKEEPKPEPEPEKETAPEPAAEPTEPTLDRQGMLDKIWDVIRENSFKKYLGCTTADEVLGDLEIAPKYKQLEKQTDEEIRKAYEKIMKVAKEGGVI